MRNNVHGHARHAIDRDRASVIGPQDASLLVTLPTQITLPSQVTLPTQIKMEVGSPDN